MFGPLPSSLPATADTLSAFVSKRFAVQQEDLMKLPPPLPRTAVGEEPAASSPTEDVKEEGGEHVARASSSAKKGGEDATNAKDVLFKAHMKRWKAIKKEKSRQHRVNSERFEERLKILLDNK